MSTSFDLTDEGDIEMNANLRRYTSNEPLSLLCLPSLAIRVSPNPRKAEKAMRNEVEGES